MRDIILLIMLIILANAFFYEEQNTIMPPAKFNGADTLKIFFVKDSIVEIKPYHSASH